MSDYMTILRTMEQSYQAQTGLLPDDASDIGIRFKVLAGELADLSKQLKTLETEAFPQTSTGTYLELHAATRGIVRKGALKAIGALQFKRETPAAVDIAIPTGLICSTAGEPSYRFVTTQSGVLSKGQTTVEIPAKADEGGSIYNTAANTVLVMITPASGIGSVSNPNPFAGGADKENDDALRRRVTESYSMISNGTNAAYYYQEAMKHEEVTSAKILPKSRGIGTVDVVVTSNGVSPSPETLSNIKAQLSKQKEINVDIAVLAAVPIPTNITISIAPLEDYDFAVLSDAIKVVIARYISSLKVGEPLLLAGLGHLLYSTQGVANYRFTLPANDVAIQPGQIITCGTIAINRLGG